MKKLSLACLMGLAACVAVADPTIANVQIRQQWPWSTDVTIDYDVQGLNAAQPKDVVVTAYDGETSLGELPVAALRGTRYSLTRDGRHRIVFDPAKSGFAGRGNLARFSVALALTDSAPDSEVLYKILDLETGAWTDVARAELLAGVYGPVETDFSFVGTTTLSDVLIWTGVTNNPAYKTTHMVFRKIPAGTFTMGSPGTEKGRTAAREAQHAVTLTRDFYLGVFKVTRAQWMQISSTVFPVKATAADYRTAGTGGDYANGVCYSDLRGNYDANPAAGGDWPADGYRVADASFLGRLRARVNDAAFTCDLPTEAQWEYACRAGTAGALYDGSANATDALLARLTPAGAKAVDAGLPNAYGLYGQLSKDSVRGEYMLDYSSETYGGTAGAAATDPVGGTASVHYPDWPRIVRGGGTRSAFRSFTKAGAYGGGYSFRVALQPAN